MNCVVGKVSEYIMKNLQLVAIFAFGFVSVDAQILYDHFDDDGPLVGSTPAIGNPWEVSTGERPIMKANGVITLSPTIDQELESKITPFSRGTIYAGVTIQATEPIVRSWIIAMSFKGPNVSGGDQVGRLFVDESPTSETFRLGVDNDKDNPMWWPEELELNQTYRVVLGFKEDGEKDVTTLWVNPQSESDPSVSDEVEEVTTEIYGFCLNNINRSGGTITLDNLIVDKVFDQVLKDAKQPPAVEITLSQNPEVEKKPIPEVENGGTKQWVIITILAVLYLILRVSIRRK